MRQKYPGATRANHPRADDRNPSHWFVQTHMFVISLLLESEPAAQINKSWNRPLLLGDGNIANLYWFRRPGDWLKATPTTTQATIKL